MICLFAISNGLVIFGKCRALVPGNDMEYLTELSAILRVKDDSGFIAVKVNDLASIGHGFGDTEVLMVEGE